MTRATVYYADREEIVFLADLATLQKVLGVHFDNPSLLEQALVHDSYVNENPQLAPASNERLEFLGDAVLGLIFADRLHHDFPHSPEGELTRFRSLLVRGHTLARMATDINLGDYLYLGIGEGASGGRSKPTNLAAALEAVIAAIYLDQGMAAARDSTIRLFSRELEKLTSQEVMTDYKSQLQQLTHAKRQKTPTYRIVDTTGPDHDRRFTAEVKVGDELLGRGCGKSKKDAETEAARAALEKLQTSFT